MTRREDDRRVTPRFSCNFSVTVKVSRDAEGSLRTPLSGQSDNVSLEGTLVLLPERVPPGSWVTLLFFPPTGEAASEIPPIEMAATVVWVQEILGGSSLRFQHGLRFLHAENLVLWAWPGRRLSDLVRAKPQGPRRPPQKVTAPSQQPETVPSEDLPAAKEAFHRAVAIMEEVLQSVRAGASFSIVDVEEAVGALLENLETSDALLVPFFSAGGHSVSPAQEMVNVCILSVKIGMQLNYPPDELRKLGLAAVLHEVGMARIPKELLERTGPLSLADRAALKQRPEEGAQLIRSLGVRYAELAHVVLQVHERTDGSGYPMGLRGEDIHEHAQIVGLADVYESLVHHRPFRPTFWPPEALKEILQQQRSSFPNRILKTLVRLLATLPVGCLVRLSTGEIGQVAAKNQDLPLRPVVAILVRQGKRLAEPQLVDLRQNALLHVQEFVTEEMLEREVQGIDP